MQLTTLITFHNQAKNRICIQFLAAFMTLMAVDYVLYMTFSIFSIKVHFRL